MDLKIRVVEKINIKMVVGMITSRVEYEEFNLSVGDTLEKLSIIVLSGDENEVAYDLTGCSVNVLITQFGEDESTNEYHSAATITDATAGKCEYQFEEGDLPTEGTYFASIEVVKNGRSMKIPEQIRFSVK